MNKQELIHKNGIYEQMFTLPVDDVNGKYKKGFLALITQMSAMASELIAMEMPRTDKYDGNPVDLEAYNAAYEKAVLKVSSAIFGFLPMQEGLTTRKEGESVDDYCGRYLLKYIGEAKKELDKFKAPSEKKAEAEKKKALSKAIADSKKKKAEAKAVGDKAAETTAVETKEAV